jgi:hypothetical protein
MYIWGLHHHERPVQQQPQIAAAVSHDDSRRLFILLAQLMLGSCDCTHKIHLSVSQKWLLQEHNATAAAREEFRSKWTTF